ncbi:metalloprotease [Streptomyces sp. bgisy130]|uniref:metalloprotease n=1 Tax=Streptomyces sp. bgisy130 TaxID=3413788 RepID=UPI003F4A662E
MRLFSRRRHTTLNTHSEPAPVRGSAGRRLRRGRVLTLAAVALGLAVSTVPLTTGSAFASVQTCLTGTLKYTATDAETGTRPTSVARNVNWELRGQTTAGGAETQLATGITDANGNFNACYNGASALPSAYVKFNSSSTKMWRVVTDKSDTATEYTFNSNTQYNTSGTIGLGDVTVPSEKVYAFKIVDVLNLLYWKRGTSSVCWTGNQATYNDCDTLTVAWGANNAEGSIFDIRTRKVLLNSNEPDSKHLILHEAGHWLQWQLFDKHDVPVTGCDGHTFNKISSATCAWSEGFADAVAAYTLGDYRYVFKGGSSFDFTNDQNTVGWDQGDQVQGRVSSSLLDLWASAGDGGNWNKTISVMTDYQSDDFHDYFVNDRPNGGLSTTGAAKDFLVKHTINY